MISEQLLDFLRTKMSVTEIADSPIAPRVRGVLHEPIRTTIADIKEYCSRAGLTPLFREEVGQHVVQIAVFRKPGEGSRYWLNIVLFFATILSTMLAGSLNSGGNPFKSVSDLVLGVPFSLSIMAILTCHELGHYFMSRREGMVTTLPYFIPVPFHFLGTFGAVIRMKSIVPSRSSLLRVGMSGPVAGFIVAVPICLIGISLSNIAPSTGAEGMLKLGDSLLFWLLARIVYPSIPAGSDLFLHPVAFAGWLGLFVTSMNLIPIGQLDGGHVAFAMFGQKRRYLYIPIFGALLALGLLWFGWYFWVILVFFIARRDPVIQDSLTPLSSRERSYGIIPLIILILTFVPQPFVI